MERLTFLPGISHPSLSSCGSPEMQSQVEPRGGVKVVPTGFWIRLLASWRLEAWWEVDTGKRGREREEGWWEGRKEEGK